MSGISKPRAATSVAWGGREGREEMGVEGKGRGGEGCEGRGPGEVSGWEGEKKREQC